MYFPPRGELEHSLRSLNPDGFNVSVSVSIGLAAVACLPWPMRQLFQKHKRHSNPLRPLNPGEALLPLMIQHVPLPVRLAVALLYGGGVSDSCRTVHSFV